jgi:tRNA modification GTPase
VASLLVAGPDATAVVDKLFHSPSGGAMNDRAAARLLYGRWQNPTLGEEVIVCHRDATHVEIHCHGGPMAARAIVESLARLGCCETPWRQWIRLSKDDGIAAAAEIVLAGAPTERTAAILHDQQAGALRRALQQIARALETGAVESAIASVRKLLDVANVGMHLVEPWHVVLAGTPNVGKSSLLNALLGYQRAIVHPTPGTTRDVVAAATAIDGWPVELVDTAGWHAKAAPLEAAGMELARAQAAAADLIVLVFDATREWSDSDESLSRQWPGALRVFNKCDLLPDPRAISLPCAGLLTSAVRGDGIAELARQIIGRLVPRDPEPGQAVPFLSEQVAGLRCLDDALTAGRWSKARALLAREDCWAGGTC